MPAARRRGPVASVASGAGRSKSGDGAHVRVVIDTNILVGAAYRPGSDSGRIVVAAQNGRVQAVVSPALVSEYRHILPRAVRRADLGPWLEEFLAVALHVEPEREPDVVRFDPSDNMLFAAALEGRAVAIVTNDRPVLQLGTFEGIEVLRPGQLIMRFPPDENVPA